MNDKEEKAWVLGRRSAWVSLLEQCMRELGYQAPKVAQLVAERERAIQQLREACAAHGDNDWPDDLYLADILEKHLLDHLGK